MNNIVQILSNNIRPDARIIIRDERDRHVIRIEWPNGLTYRMSYLIGSLKKMVDSDCVAREIINNISASGHNELLTSRTHF